MKKIFSAFMAAALLAVAGCAENGGARPEAMPQSADTEETAKPKPIATPQEPKPAEAQESEIKIEINTELLSEFGMTFAELEEKYGEAVSAKASGIDFDFVNSEGKTQAFINSEYTFFFERGVRGYNFSISESDEDRTLDDGTPLPNPNTRYQISGDLQVKDLILNMEEPMKTEDFLDAIGHTGEYFAGILPIDDPWLVPFDLSRFPFYTNFGNPQIVSYLNYSGDYLFNIEHPEGIITPDSYLKIRYQ
jgi:hypothetical protein